jgi:peptidoglycan/LPS O-acetylase OafA/YrhL
VTHHHNNFDGLRLTAALSVLVSHEFALSGRVEPTLFGQTVGHVAVLVFFVISGYLVTQSWLNDPHPIRFAWRRALRIAPGLIVAVPLTAGVVAAMGLSGFPHNRLSSLNGSLWTIGYEVCCYVLLVAFALHARLAAALVLAVTTMLIVGGAQMQVHFLSEFGLFFAAGALMARWSFPLPLSAAGVGLVLASHGMPLLGFLGCAPLLIAIGRASWPGLRSAGRWGDLSYGVYIYAFPVQQVGVALWPHAPYLALLAISLAVVLSLAFASWHIIERPAMRLKPYSRLDPIIPARSTA